MRQFVEVAAREGKRPIFYSTSGYSKPALEVGEQAGVVMFAVAGGLPVAVTSHAMRVMVTGLGVGQ